MLIPRIFHQIWLGPKPFPEEHLRYQETWRSHHPGWELRLWTEDNYPRDLRRPEPSERLREPAMRSNFLRLELLWRFGGVYVDTDFECLRSIEPLIADATFFIGRSKPGSIHDALYGSVAGHRILDIALDTLVSSDFYGYGGAVIVKQLGPILDAHRDEVLFLESEILYPTMEERRNAYAVHHREQSWREPGSAVAKVKQAQAKARRWHARYHEAVAERDRWRARCEEAEAELDRLRGAGVGRTGDSLLADP
jgi:mannosyltransferase OCH1-like enzyme